MSVSLMMNLSIGLPEGFYRAPSGLYEWVNRIKKFQGEGLRNSWVLTNGITYIWILLRDLLIPKHLLRDFLMVLGHRGSQGGASWRSNQEAKGKP